jgi:hypothetical protein
VVTWYHLRQCGNLSLTGARPHRARFGNRTAPREVTSSDPPTDMSGMGLEQRREPRFRSRGEVTIFCAGIPELPATIQDMGASGLGLVAQRALPTGAVVRIESHGHMADGEVRHCRPVGKLFHIGVALQSLPTGP